LWWDRSNSNRRETKDLAYRKWFVGLRLVKKHAWELLHQFARASGLVYRIQEEGEMPVNLLHAPGLICETLQLQNQFSMTVKNPFDA